MRMGSQTSKQYLELAGKSILDRSIELILRCDSIEHVFVAIAEGDQNWLESSWYNATSVSSVIGGRSRAHSVLNALHEVDKISSSADWVVVHDAARPCVNLSDANRWIQKLTASENGGIVSLSVNDTLREKQNDGSLSLVDREQFSLAQTPQVFPHDLLLAALTQALESNEDITDEAAAMINAGHSIELIEGNAFNFKITRPSDFEIAKLLFQSDVFS